MATRIKKTWREKLLHSKDLPKIVTVGAAGNRRSGQQTMVVPAPIEVDRLMRKVRAGRVTTIDALRRRLAAQHGAATACPLTTGIFAWIAAHAAAEAEEAGKSRITPYWRTLKAGGELNPKFPGGLANVRRRLEAEGHKILVRGKRAFVET